MSPTLIFLLGNRDLQIKQENSGHELIRQYFIQHNDGEDYVINKNKGAGFSFWEASQEVFEHIEHLQQDLIFPMIQGVIDHLELDNPRLVFCGSEQKPTPHFQDSFYFAQSSPKLLQPARLYLFQRNLCL